MALSRYQHIFQYKGMRGEVPGMGILMPICPASTFFRNRSAVAPERVKIAVPLPYSFALIRSIAASRVGASRQTRTGPKISSV